MLLDRGDHVWAIDIRMPASSPTDEVEWQTVDLRDAAAVARAAEAVTLAVHGARVALPTPGAGPAA